VKWEELKLKIWGAWPLRIVVSRVAIGGRSGASPLEQGASEGDSPVPPDDGPPHDASSQSRVVWEYSPKCVVNFT